MFLKPFEKSNLSNFLHWANVRLGEDVVLDLTGNIDLGADISHERDDEVRRILNMRIHGRLPFQL